MDVDELPLLAAGIRRAGEVEKSGPAEDSVFRGGCSSYPADVMRPPKRCSSDFTSKKPAKLGMNEDVFPSLICEEKVDTPYLGHEVKPTLFSLNHEGSGGKSMKKSGTLPCAKRLRTEQPDDSMNIDGFDDLKSTATQIGSETNQFPCPEKSEMVKKKRRRDGSRTDKKSNKASTRSKYESFLSKAGFSCSDSVSGGNTIPGHSPRATCAADILCEMKRKSRSKASRSNTSGKTKWPKAPSQKTMKARKSPSSADKTEKPYRSGDRYNPSPLSVKHKLVSEKNGVAHKNTTVREPIRPPAPVEHGESSARMERDLGVQPRSLHMNPVRKTVEACGSEQSLRKAAAPPKGSSLGFGGTYIKDWSSRGRTKRI